MRHWYFCWRTLVLMSQQNPPQFVETLMLMLAIVLLVVWMFRPDWPYLLLGLSYIVGASASILVRETLLPSPQPRATRVAALLLLAISLYGFADLVLSL